MSLTPGTPLEVVVAGGGVAAIEFLLALNDMARDHVAVTVVAPEAYFTCRPPSTPERFAQGHTTRYELQSLVRELGGRLIPEKLVGVCHEQRVVTTTSGAVLPYDVLVLAVGARRFPAFRHAITLGTDNTAAALTGLLADLELGYVHRVAFVVPSGASWTLPLYELAIMMARDGWAMGIDDAHYWLITPEPEPLAIFGGATSAAVHDMLEPEGITFAGSTFADVQKGIVACDPRTERIRVDRVISLPLLDGPRTPGVPTDADGFILVDARGHVRGMRDVYAVGDATNFPIKQGGLACQQADAVAELVAAAAGAAVQPTSFRPTLRAKLLTGGRDRFLQCPVGPEHGAGQFSEQPLWQPPTKIAGRYLSRYLAGRDGVAVRSTPRVAGTDGDRGPAR